MVAERSPRRSRSGTRAGTSTGNGVGESPRRRGSDGLELDEDAEFQRRVWIFERVGWFVMALLLLAALLGLFGRGPLSQAYEINPEAPMALEFERFGRDLCDSQLRVHLLPGSTRGGEARVWIDRRLLDQITDVRFTPEPVKAIAEPGWVVYRFATPDTGSPSLIEIQYKPELVGALSGRIGLVGREPSTLRQWIYP